MTPIACLQSVVTPAFEMLGNPFNSKDAEVMILAIGLQESKLQFEDQFGNGPARGLWQAEIEFVSDVVARGAKWLEPVCERLGVPMIPHAIWGRLDRDDILACAVARIRLKLDPRSIPVDPITGWRIYFTVWGPGAPRPDDWDGNWEAAYAAVYPGMQLRMSQTLEDPDNG